MMNKTVVKQCGRNKMLVAYRRINYKMGICNTENAKEEGGERLLKTQTPYVVCNVLYD